MVAVPAIHDIVGAVGEHGSGGDDSFRSSACVE